MLACAGSFFLELRQQVGGSFDRACYQLREERDKDRKIHHCITMNNTVIASPRVLIPLMELNQNADGSINIPKALQPYMNGCDKISK